MPLIHSPAKKPFEHNIKSELDAGKPMNQSLAIAYAVKRRAQEKKKMAEGGMVDDENRGRGYFKPHEGAQMGGHNESLHPMDEPAGLTETSSLPDEAISEERQDAFFAHGGLASPKHMAMKIMAKRKMANGGPVLDPEKQKQVMAGMNRAFGNAPEAKAPPSPQSANSDYDFSPEEKAKMKAKRDALSYADGGIVDNEVPPPGGVTDFLSDEEQDPYPEDPRMKRKRTISNIMRDLHSKHRGMA